MSSGFDRSTRQRSKPVFLNLIKTDSGFEIVDDKFRFQNVPAKNLATKPERPPLAYSKSLLPAKSAERPNSPPPGAQGRPMDALLRSSTGIKPMNPPSRINITNGMQMPDRNQIPRTGSDTIKREILPFSSPFANPNAKLEHSTTMPDISLSSHFERPMTFAPQDPRSSRPSNRNQRRYTLAIPSSARWFDMDRIHEIEKDSFPEFFCGKPTKTPEVYKRARNYMISQYRLTPAHYLTSTTCRRCLGGDACSVIKMHAFLERWGLINFYIDPINYPKSTIITKTNFITDRRSRYNHSELPIELPEDVFPKNEDPKQETEAAADSKGPKKLIRPMCDICGSICGFSWYQQKSADQYQAFNPIAEGALEQAKAQEAEQKERKLILCTNCFSQEEYPKFYSTHDFYKVDILNPAASQASTQSSTPLRRKEAWTQEETLKMIELIQRHGDNWGEIQRNMPNKTINELAAHYLRLPFKNVTSINIIDIGDTKGYNDSRDLRNAESAPTVFGDFSNPILQHAAIFKSLLSRFREQKRRKEAKKAEAAQAAEAAKKAEAAKAAQAAQAAQEALAAQAAQEAQAAQDAQMEIEVAEGEKEVKVEDKPGSEIVKVLDDEQNGTITVEKADSGPKEAMDEEVVKIETVSQAGSKGAVPVPVLEKVSEELEKVVKEKEVPPKVKTPEQILEEIAEKAVELQLRKMNQEIDFIEDYEQMLVHDRKQHGVLAQIIVFDKMESARKKLEAASKQNSTTPAPSAGYQEGNAAGFDQRDGGHYYPFGSDNNFGLSSFPASGGFAADDLRSLDDF